MSSKTPEAAKELSFIVPNMQTLKQDQVKEIAEVLEASNADIDVRQLANEVSAKQGASTPPKQLEPMSPPPIDASWQPSWQPTIFDASSPLISQVPLNADPLDHVRAGSITSIPQVALIPATTSRNEQTPPLDTFVSTDEFGVHVGMPPTSPTLSSSDPILFTTPVLPAPMPAVATKDRKSKHKFMDSIGAENFQVAPLARSTSPESPPSANSIVDTPQSLDPKPTSIRKRRVMGSVRHGLYLAQSEDNMFRSTSMLDVMTEAKDQMAASQTQLNGMLSSHHAGTQKKAFLILLARAWYKSGAPSYLLETRLRTVALSLNIDCEFFVLPYMILVSSGGLAAAGRSYVIRASLSWNLAQFEDLSSLMTDLVAGDVTFKEATKILEDITASPKPFPDWFYYIVVFGISSAVSCVALWGAPWVNMPIAFVFGAFVGGVSWMQEKYNLAPFLTEFGMCAVVGFFTDICVYYVMPPGTVCFQTLAFSGIIWLLPGLGLTLSVMEIGTNNLISGATRLISALIFAAVLAYGLTIGAMISAWIPFTNVAATCPSIVDTAVWCIFLMPLLGVAFGLLLGARLNQLPVPCIASLAGWLITRYLSVVVDTVTTNLVASFVIASFGIFYSTFVPRTTSHPTILIGIMMLVPGSVSVRGLLTSFTNPSSGSAGSFVEQILEVALGLFLGLFLANNAMSLVARWIRSAILKATSTVHGFTTGEDVEMSHVGNGHGVVDYTKTN